MNPRQGPSARRPVRWTLLLALLAAVPLAGSAIGSRSPAWGQTLALQPGAYEIDLVYPQVTCVGPPDMIWVRGQRYPVCWGEAQSPRDSGYPKDPLFVLASSTGNNRLDYQWQKWNGRFEIADSWITLIVGGCGYDAIVGGRVLGRDKFYMVDDWGYRLHKLAFRPKQPPPRSAAAPQQCKQSRVRNVLASRVASTMSAAATAQTEEQRRTVTGQLLLGLHNPSTDSDVRLWSCLFFDGNYPGIHFVDERTHADEWSFVWPSALFRVTLAAGATYSWRVAPPIRCGIMRPQSFRGAFQVPRAPAPTEERLLLGCLVADEGFSDCQSWWLRRP